MKNKLEEILNNLCVVKENGEMGIDYPKSDIDFATEWQEGAKEEIVLDILKAIKERIKHYEG